MAQDIQLYDRAAAGVVDLGNRLAEQDHEPDLWEIADGLLAGAVHFWLFARQPCGDPACTDCAPISTAQERLAELMTLAEQFAVDSDYFHHPQDVNVGRA